MKGVKGQCPNRHRQFLSLTRKNLKRKGKSTEGTYRRRENSADGGEKENPLDVRKNPTPCAPKEGEDFQKKKRSFLWKRPTIEDSTVGGKIDFTVSRKKGNFNSHPEGIHVCCNIRSITPGGLRTLSNSDDEESSSTRSQL